jgi:hypothetical protein
MQTASARQHVYYRDDPPNAASDAARKANFPKFHAALNDPARKWQVEIVSALAKFAKLQAGWDSYGAPPVNRDAGHFVLEILQGIMRPQTPIPQIIPSSVGGVQLEWHEKGIDLELHVTAPYKFEFWFQDHQDPNSVPISLELTDDFSELKKPILLLTSR